MKKKKDYLKLLTSDERKHLEGKLKPETNYRYQLDWKIREKAKEALKDLTLIAQKRDRKQFDKIFTATEVIPFIQVLLWRKFEKEKFKSNNSETGKLQWRTDISQQWYLAWLIRAITTKRIFAGKLHFSNADAEKAFWNQAATFWNEVIIPISWIEIDNELDAIYENGRIIKERIFDILEKNR